LWPMMKGVRTAILEFHLSRFFYGILAVALP
jgi:hypothetical protein